MWRVIVVRFDGSVRENEPTYSEPKLTDDSWWKTILDGDYLKVEEWIATKVPFGTFGSATNHFIIYVRDN